MIDYNVLDSLRQQLAKTETKLFALIGNPIEHSISHITHNAFFQKTKSNAHYIKLNLIEEGLPYFLEYASNHAFGGVSVTMPFKTKVVPFIENRMVANKSGAINTLSFLDKKIYGLNTDGKGALNAIEKYIPIKNKRIISIGAGGAARGIIAEAVDRGAEVYILNRNKPKAQELAKLFSCSVLESESEIEQVDYDLLINTTPLTAPLSSTYLQPNKIVFDINTRNLQSEFLNSAHKKGCRIVYGYEMFIEQALGQFDFWGISRDEESTAFFRNCVKSYLFT